ncbi:glycosyltransferase [Alkalihalobacillus macyae]|uniref:glycosyltransferase family protein n=1 Tax=Guptibacillus hwajinpoensis TaxID=208199 RepID=UPI00273B657A|nr:glycosyltransferase [Alkalihalobacillus macyae]MDP4552070.1 glycosyltransferase [Alkalihalobacillus macyae]
MTHKLKILFITRDFSNHIEKSSFYLSNELHRQADLMLWHSRGHISVILANLPNEPDFILLNDFKPDYCPRIQGLKSCKVPVGILMHDLHYKVSQRKRFIVKENIQHIFSIYRDPFLRWYPEFEERMTWFPFHVPKEIFKDYKLTKVYNWLMMGAMDEKYYPLRDKMKDTMKTNEGFLHYQHPGYGIIDKGDGGILAGEAYAREINRAKMFLTCDSTLHLPLLKYFEVLACNTLLLAPGNQELGDLGFDDGETFVSVNEDNFKEKAYYYLNNEKERIRIAKNGFHKVRDQHSTEVRASQLIKYMKDIVNKS